MAGKSFKGNLEVLNLSDIFQSLAMNRHSGTLVVNDGKREKKIFFAEGEITLLSTSRRQKLGDLLIAGDKITEEDLDLALKLQKQSRKKLGEILVEEGFCEEEDISRLLRRQVEDGLYDLFLWRKAEFEFLADQMPNDMAAESPNLTRLNINTNSLIMEALRRLDEWTLIQDLVPSTKEVFQVIDAEKLQTADVPDRIKSEPELIDGKTNVEMLAEKYYMSDFDVCQHLAELVKVGAARAHNQEELAERAEAAYALNDFAGSAALYGRLAEYFPDEPKIMVPLADSMRRSGADKQALALYEELAARLEQDGQDADRLRQCYEAIMQLDPTRLDLAQKLENIELELASSQGRSIVMPLIAVLILALGGGGAFFFRDKLFGEKKVVSGDSAELLEKAKRAESSGEYADMHGHMLKLWKEHPESKEFDKVELPILVRTIPPGYDVYVNGVYQGVTSVEKPQLVCKYGQANLVKVEVYGYEGKGKGEEPLRTRDLAAEEFHETQFVLYDRPAGSFIGEGWMESGVLPAGKDIFLAPSRDGLLRVLKRTDRGLVAEDAFDRKVRLGENGDVFTQLVADGERVLLGTVDQGVIALRCKDGVVSDVVQTLCPAEFEVVTTPLLLPAEGGLEGGRVIFATAGAEVLGYPSAGGKEPLWRTPIEGVATGDFAYGTSGGCLIADNGGRVYSIAPGDGELLWTWIAPQEVYGSPLLFGGSVLVSLEGGTIVALDPANGKERKTLYTDPAGMNMHLYHPEDGSNVLFVSTSRGHVRALTDGVTPIWEDDFKRASSRPPRLAFRGPRVLVAADTPEVFALLKTTGTIVWQAEFPEKNGFAVSPFSLTEKGYFVGTNKQFLHYFEPR